MEEINLVPCEILYILPSFDGSESLLGSFINKCDYVVKHFSRKGSEAQDLYLLHCITSKLVGTAAVFVSEKNEVKNWEELKELLVQRFGDLRSEECIASELDSLQIKQGESFVDFYHRLLSVKNKVLSKINPDLDANIKKSKELVYEKMAKNTLLFNLPEDYVRTVRCKGADTLNDVLKIVTEEESFYIEYRNRKRNNQRFPGLGYRPNYSIENNSKQGATLFGQANASHPFGAPQPQTNPGSTLFSYPVQIQDTTQVRSQPSAINPMAQGQGTLFGSSKVAVPASSAKSPFESSKPGFSFGINLPDNPPKILFNNETKTFQNTATPQ